MERPSGNQAQASAVAMTKEEERALREQLARLLQEHRDLDAAIEALVISPGFDLIQGQWLKKRKLVLRDKIRRIEDQLTPDIIAQANTAVIYSAQSNGAGRPRRSSLRAYMACSAAAMTSAGLESSTKGAIPT